MYISYIYFIHHTQTVCTCMHHIHTNRAYTHCIHQYIQTIYIKCIRYSHKNTICIKYMQHTLYIYIYIHSVHITYITLYASGIYCIITYTMYSSHTHFIHHINIVCIIYTVYITNTYTVYFTYTLYTSHKHCIHHIQTLYISNKH